MPKRPFDMVPLPGSRCKSKPRRSGLTMVVDQGMPLGFQAGLLALAGDCADLAKIRTGTALPGGPVEALASRSEGAALRLPA